MTRFPASATTEQTVSGQVPTTPRGAMPPRETRMDVTDLGKWIHGQVEFVLADRRDAEVDWLKIRYILNGHHDLIYDSKLNAVLPNMDREDDDVGAYTNLTRNRYRRELGRRLSVSIKMNVIPRNFSNPRAFYFARRGRLALQYWVEHEGRFDEVYDQFNQMILRMNMAALLAEPSFDGTTAKVSAIPAADLFPLPGTAASLQTAEGLARRNFLSESFLEKAVEAGELGSDVLTEISSHRAFNNVGSPLASLGTVYSQDKIKGATGYYFYFFPSREWPQGRYGLMIGDRIYAIENRLPIGGAPICVWDMKTDADWYGDSFCGALVGLNLEDDRQFSNEIAMGEVNRHGGWTFVPEDMFSINDLQQRLGGFVPYRNQALGLDKRDVFFQVRPPQLGPESSLVSRRIDDEADATASHFAVSRGEGPGRVDSDAGIERLLAQTDMPNEPFFKRTRNCLVECFGRVLNILGQTWSQEKWISIVGPEQVPQELAIRPGEVPDTTMVEIKVGDLVPNSRLAAMRILTGLRQQQDISPAEFKRALIINGLEPHGISLDDSDEKFAISKVLYIYNDGQRPRQWPIDDDFDLEPHRAVVRVARRFMNNIEFKLETAPAVRRALYDMLMQHQVKLTGELGRLTAQMQFEETDSARAEEYVSADEAQLGPDNAMILTSPDGSMY